MSIRRFLTLDLRGAGTSAAEVVVGSELGAVFLVFEYLEHDLASLLEHMTEAYSVAEVRRREAEQLRAVRVPDGLLGRRLARELRAHEGIAVGVYLSRHGERV